MTAPGQGGGIALERVTVRPLRPDFAFVSLRLDAVHLSGIEARRDGQGRVTLTCPTRQDRSGRAWPVYALQPAALAEATAAVARLWGSIPTR